MRKHHGLMIVLSSPSGGGKTTLAHRLLKSDKGIVRSVSCTTRRPRAGEKNGRDYFFITPGRFKAMIAARAFLEWARVHRHFYGTPRAWVEEQLEKGKDVLFVIDVQGGKALKRGQPDAVLVFLRPPSLRVLRERLLGRQSEDAQTLRVRLGNARRELKEGRRYDYRVVNDRLARAVAEVAGIIREERKRKARGGASGVAAPRRAGKRKEGK